MRPETITAFTLARNAWAAASEHDRSLFDAASNAARDLVSQAGRDLSLREHDLLMGRVQRLGWLRCAELLLAADGDPAAVIDAPDPLAA